MRITERKIKPNILVMSFFVIAVISITSTLSPETSTAPESTPPKPDSSDVGVDPTETLEGQAQTAGLILPGMNELGMSDPLASYEKWGYTVVEPEVRRGTGSVEARFTIPEDSLQAFVENGGGLTFVDAVNHPVRSGFLTFTISEGILSINTHDPDGGLNPPSNEFRLEEEVTSLHISITTSNEDNQPTLVLSIEYKNGSPEDLTIPVETDADPENIRVITQLNNN